jgi:hypothetical protein
MIPPQVSQGKIRRNFAKFLTKTDEVPFRKSLLGLISLLWNVPGNSKKGLENSADLRDVVLRLPSDE